MDRDRPCILVVDDDPDIREAMAELLGSDGFDVFVAEHGRAALDRLQIGMRPDAILLDLMMPVMNGFELLHEMASDDELRRIPVVVLSASHSYDADDLRVAAVLRKPVDVTGVVHVLERVVSGAA